MEDQYGNIARNTIIKNLMISIIKYKFYIFYFINFIFQSLNIEFLSLYFLCIKNSINQKIKIYFIFHSYIIYMAETPCPLKIMWKWKNARGRVQYNAYIFIGNIVPNDIVQILEKITDL